MASQPGSGPYAFDNLPGLKELRKRVRLANLEERSERSKLYADVLSLINSFYPHGGAAWRKTTELLPRGGREDSGGSYLPAAIIFTALKRMLRDDRTRTNGLMLIRRIAKLSGSITQDYRPVLQGLSKALDFPLDIHAASKGAWDMIDVVEFRLLHIFRQHDRLPQRAIVVRCLLSLARLGGKEDCKLSFGP